MGVSTALTIIFVVFKLVGVITWPWLWVLLPILIVWGFWGLIILIDIIAAAFKEF